MKSYSEKDGAKERSTFVVPIEIFQEVYDSPSSLPGKYKWVTADDDVRKIEKILGMDSKTIGAPLWVSGDSKNCPKCGREINWLDIISSGLNEIHQREMIAKVILGDRKFVNVENPRAIADLQCYKCKTPIKNLRSFKCHNWAYARGAMLKVIAQMRERVK